MPEAPWLQERSHNACTAPEMAISVPASWLHHRSSPVVAASGAPRSSPPARLSCSACHGVDGHGHGPAASAFQPPPADLTQIAQRHGGSLRGARQERVPLPSPRTWSTVCSLRSSSTFKPSSNNTAPRPQVPTSPCIPEIGRGGPGYVAQAQHAEATMAAEEGQEAVGPEPLTGVKPEVVVIRETPGAWPHGISV